MMNDIGPLISIPGVNMQDKNWAAVTRRKIKDGVALLRTFVQQTLQSNVINSLIEYSEAAVKRAEIIAGDPVTA